MGTFSDNLLRLKVAALTGSAPPDLLRWAVEVIGEALPHAERLELRDRLLREAAARVGGSRWARAKRLAQEVEALAAEPRLRERASDDGVRDIVARAVAVAPAPRHVRQLFRLLGG